MTYFLAIPGSTELLYVLLAILLLFGGKKLPELARAMGTSITQFRKGLKEEEPQSLEGGGKDESGGDA